MNSKPTVENLLKYQEIAEILHLISSSSCDELVLETEGVKLVVRRHAGGAVAPANTASHPSLEKQVLPGNAASTASPSAPMSPGKLSPAGGISGGGAKVVGAPMVGTFYRSPSPDAPPFVEVGGKVKAGDPLCVIEVMKLFTTIHAEFGGTIRKIGVENAQFVEFDQMLFIVDPD